MPFNSLLLGFFEGSNTDELIQHMFAYQDASKKPTDA